MKCQIEEALKLGTKAMTPISQTQMILINPHEDLKQSFGTLRGPTLYNVSNLY